MSDLTEIEQRILCTLEEAGQENVFRLINTILRPSGDDREVLELKRALKGLVERDFALMGWYGPHPNPAEKQPKEQSLAFLEGIEEWFSFDTNDNLWGLSKGTYGKIKCPAVFATRPARDVAFKILDERGYQWWEQGDEQK
jgi:hypothetical protein